MKKIVLWVSLLSFSNVFSAGLDYPVKISTNNADSTSLNIIGVGFNSKCLIQVGQDEEYKLNRVFRNNETLSFLKVVELTPGLVDIFVKCTSEAPMNVSFLNCTNGGACTDITPQLFPEINQSPINMARQGEVFKKLKVIK